MDVFEIIFQSIEQDLKRPATDVDIMSYLNTQPNAVVPIEVKYGTVMICKMHIDKKSIMDRFKSYEIKQQLRKS